MDRSTAPRAFSLPDAVDLTVCDREPIHIPGAIQPHGLLLVADPATFAVVAGAGALEEIVGPEWLGASLPHLLQQDIAALVEGVHLGPGGTVLGTRFLDYDVALHRTDSWLLAELEPVGDDRRSAGEILTWLDTIATGFERASTLTALCDRAAVAFRALTGFDRVMIYRFLDDDAGRSIARRLSAPSLSGERYSATGAGAVRPQSHPRDSEHHICPRADPPGRLRHDRSQ
jgi:light-regulated signal transduction histidine kinase (bacteriophytochrome)